MKKMLEYDLYLDLDGCIADFNREPNGVERFATEKGFFKNLLPIKHNHEIADELFRKFKNVFILSASPNEQADQDKMEWIHLNIPNARDEQVILCRNGEVKAKFVRDIKNSILIDDFSTNLIEWKENGGYAIKFLGHYDRDLEDSRHNKHNINGHRDYARCILEAILL